VVTDEKVLVDLPAITAANAEFTTSQSAWHTYEIVYVLSGPAWKLWTALPSQTPILPVPVLAFQRTWCLPLGTAPLLGKRYRQLPCAGRDLSAPDSGFPFPLDTWRSPRRWVYEEIWESEQRRRLAEASAALAAAFGSRTTTLGELLDRLTSETLPDQPLVVDGQALRHAGLTSTSPASTSGDQNAPPWEAFGLAYVPSPAGPLFTTRRELEIWQEAARLAHRGETDVLSSSFKKAVAEAAARGHDDSGRFNLATEWLRGSDTVSQDMNADSLEAVMGELHAEYWTEWEPLAGTDDEGPMLVVGLDELPIIAWVLAGVLCLAFWRMPERGRLPMLLTWLAAAGLGYSWLPLPLQVLAWIPLLLGLAAALCWYLVSKRRALQSGKPANARTFGPLTALGLLLAVAAGIGLPRVGISKADEPAEPVVFLIREANGEKYSVLASPDLLERLQTLVQRAETAVPGAVLVKAEYDGKADGDSLIFKAEFQVYCNEKRPTSVHLPLDGVQLDGDTLVDGVRVFPLAAKPPLAGYTLRINPATDPLHRVTSHFRTRVNASGDERESALTLPIVLNSKLALELPAASRGAEALAGELPIRGRQRTVKSPAGIRLETDLGRLTAPLKLRWSHESGPARPAKLIARESYLWDVRPEAALLTALVSYNVTNGTATVLELEVPERLDVLSVKLGSGSGKTGPRLKSWGVTGAGRDRLLKMEFQNPLSDDFVTVIQFAPRGPLVAGEQLPLPLPRVSQIDKGLVACQITDLEGAIQTQGLTATGREREQFAESWRQSVLGDLRLPGLPTHAFSFDRATTGAPSLKLNMHYASPRLKGSQHIAWNLSGDQSECKAVIQLSAPNGDLSLVEWDVPSDFFVARISGNELACWSQTGSRVQAWLDSPRKSAALELTGWQKTPRPKPPGPMEFQLPCIQLLSAASVENTIRLRGGNGVSFEEAERVDLSPLPNTKAQPAELGYFSPHARYAARFRVRQSPGASEARALTVAEIRGRNLAFTALVALQVDRSDSRTVSIELHGWSHDDVRCEVQEGAAKVQRLQGVQVPSWSLELPAGASGSYRVTLTGSVPLDQVGAGKPMPDIRIRGATRVERWSAISADGTLRADAIGGLELVPNTLEGWADPLRRKAATFWRVAAENWRLMLHPAQEIAHSQSVRLLLIEQECCIADGRHWTYEATFLLNHEANADLTVLMPGRSRLLGLSVDDAAMTPLQPAPGRLWVPLPGRAGSRRLRLRWTFEDSSVERPQLQLPQLDGVADGPAVWTVYVPVGFQATPNEDTQNRVRTALPASAVCLELHRAAAQHRLSIFLANRLKSGDTSVLAALGTAQQHFYRACHYAEQLLAAGIGDSDASPDGQPLIEWLKGLREESIQLARQQGFESLRAEAEIQVTQYRRATNGEADMPDGPTGSGNPTRSNIKREAWPDGLMLRRGATLYWQGTAGTLPARLTLVAEHTHEVRKAMGLSAVWIILLSAIALAARFPSLGSWLRLFWPEQIALLACLVWQTFGLNLLLVFLILLGVCGRVVSLLQILARRLRRTNSAPPPALVA
jgi:hypothetical protein